MLAYFKEKKRKENEYIEQIKKDKEAEIYEWLDTLGRDKVFDLEIKHNYNKFNKEVFTHVFLRVNTYEERDFLYEDHKLSFSRLVGVINNHDYTNYNLKIAERRYDEGKESIVSYANDILESDHGTWARKMIVEEYEKRRREIQDND